MTSGAALSEELRSAKDKYAKLNLINQVSINLLRKNKKNSSQKNVINFFSLLQQEQQIDLDKVRARLETVSKELQTTKAQLERLRAMSPDADIQVKFFSKFF